MIWTTQKPTQPGWYWWAVMDHSAEFVAKVLWVSSAKKKLVAYWVNDAGQVRYNYVDAMLGEWAGPIPEPTERDEREEQP